MPDEYRKHPSRCATDRLRRLLSAERRELTERRVSLKRDIRALVTELGTLEQRLDDISASEEYLDE